MQTHKRSDYFFTGIVFLSAILFIVFSAKIRNNIIQALSLAVGTVIPGLFPFLVLSDFACRANLLQNKSKTGHFTANKVFGLPSTAMPAVLFGLTGGYITGVRTALTLFESGRITKEQAQKLCCFCVSPGLAFSVCTVGNAMLGNTATGILLFVCCTMAAVCLGILMPDRKNAQTCDIPAPIDTTTATAFTKSVQNSAAACLTISAWMALFSSAQAIFESIAGTQVNAVFTLFAEVSAGCLQAANAGQLPLCAAVSGFGGLCIFCQLLPDLIFLEVKITTFLKYRLLQGALSALFCKIGLLLFPQLGSMQNVANVFLSRANPTASFFLLLMCFIFILDLAPTNKICYDNKKTKNIRTKDDLRETKNIRCRH